MNKIIFLMGRRGGRGLFFMRYLDNLIEQDQQEQERHAIEGLEPSVKETSDAIEGLERIIDYTSKETSALSPEDNERLEELLAGFTVPNIGFSLDDLAKALQAFADIAIKLNIEEEQSDKKPLPPYLKRTGQLRKSIRYSSPPRNNFARNAHDYMRYSHLKGKR